LASSYALAATDATLPPRVRLEAASHFQNNAGLTLAALNIYGQTALTSATEFHVGLDPLHSGNDSVEAAYATLHLSDTTYISAGKKRTNQGGYERRRPRYQNFLPNPYLDKLLPYEFSQQLVECGWHEFISVQIVDDVTTKASSQGVFTDTAHQPAAILQLEKTLANFSVLLQTSAYDLNKSYFIGLSASMSTAYLNSFLDVQHDRRRQKFLGGAAIYVPFATYNHTGLYLEGLPSAAWHPIVKLLYFDVQQPQVAAIGLKDRHFNRNGYDDNARLGMLGVAWDYDERWELLAGYYEIQGRFLSAEGRPARRTSAHLLLSAAAVLTR